MFRVALLREAKTGNNPINPTGERLNKRWYVHTMKYYLAMKRNKLLIHALTWSNLKNILLSEGGQITKDLIL